MWMLFYCQDLCYLRHNVPISPEIIDGNNTDSVVAFISGEGSTSILSGFTIKNGRSDYDTPGFGDGGGIRISNSSPTIKDNIIGWNQACGGAGISIISGGPTIERNNISNNRTRCANIFPLSNFKNTGMRS